MGNESFNNCTEIKPDFTPTATENPQVFPCLELLRLTSAQWGGTKGLTVQRMPDWLVAFFLPDTAWLELLFLKVKSESRLEVGFSNPENYSQDG